jgi:uncharacterized membrane protein
VPGYQVSTTIEAPIDLAWSVLVDVERMPEWTSSMRSVRLLDGELRRGSRVHIKQPWLRAAIWTVDLFDPPIHFSWRSRTGTIETVASHLLEDRDHATVATFAIQHEGPGAGVIALLTGPLTRRYVDRELSGLKTRTEQLANPNPS